MIALKFSAYARHRNCSPGYITKLKNEGRLVLTASGLVDVEASDRLIEQTAGNRADVAERNAKERAVANSTEGVGQHIDQPEKTAPRATVQATDSDKIGASLPRL